MSTVWCPRSVLQSRGGYDWLVHSYSFLESPYRQAKRQNNRHQKHRAGTCWFTPCLGDGTYNIQAAGDALHHNSHPRQESCRLTLVFALRWPIGGLHHRPHNTISSRCSWVQSWRLLMLWLCLYGLPQGATATEPCGHLLAANCILCPDATVAAQHLTGNSAQLPISNAAFSGSCDSAYNSKGYILITNMSGHELAPLMPLGG